MPMPRSKAELVELYMDALRDNLDAMPPAGLDAETAFVIRAMMVQRNNTPSDEVRDRVWNRTLFALYCNPDETLPAATPPLHTPNTLLANAPEDRLGNQGAVWIMPRALVTLVTMVMFVLMAGLVVQQLQPMTEQASDPQLTVIPRDRVLVDNSGNLVIDVNLTYDADLRPVYEVASTELVYHVGGAVIPNP
ncbi:MAG: hypothetical protein OHK0046_12270 [Anaerolineae bacterium]